MTTATISPSGQIAIPKAVRERLGLEAGTQLSIDVQGEQLVIKRVDHNYPDWRSMEGMLRGGESLTKALEEDRAAERAHDDARAKGR
jgi:AbrB family looped-hinge helix DNA binding protein